MNVEIEAAAQYILTQKPVFTRLFYGYVQSLYRYGIFCTNVYVTFLRADRIAGNRHCFENAMRVALEHGAVHKRAGVTLVRVAAYVFYISLCLSRELPFETGGEACAASAAQSRRFQFGNDLIRAHFEENFRKRRIIARSNRLLYAFRSDYTAVSECYSELMLIKGNFRKGNNASVLVNGAFV